MRYGLSKITLAGRELTIRSLEMEDAESTIRFMKRVYSESEYLTMYPEEFSFTAEEEAEFIRRISISDDEVLLGAFESLELVGTCRIGRISTSSKLKHRGEISISIINDFQGIGLGTFLINEVLAYASKMGISQVELNVASENDRAIRLYDKLGFVKVGEIPNGLRFRDGRSMGFCLMVLSLDC